MGSAEWQARFANCNGAGKNVVNEPLAGGETNAAAVTAAWWKMW